MAALVFLVWLAFIIATIVMAQRKGQLLAGILLGFLLGPIGFLVVALMSGDRLPCPYCKELVIPGALLCPHCRSQLPQLPPGYVPGPARINPPK
jgi:hypothetical protein